MTTKTVTKKKSKISKAKNYTTVGFAAETALIKKVDVAARKAGVTRSKFIRNTLTSTV